MDTINIDNGAYIVRDIIEIIHKNAAMLSEIDGAVADGDHGINMDKGFQLVKERLGDEKKLALAFDLLGETLMSEIGGSMGPLYGTFFLNIAKTIGEEENLSATLWSRALDAGLSGIQAVGGAVRGDKTIVDCLEPACLALRLALHEDADFASALDAMVDGAKEGKEETKQMVAKMGRAARLGERSKGTYDAGAVSCFLILESISTSMQRMLATPEN